MVSKEEYSAWEKEVIAAFYDGGRTVTQLVPQDGRPAVLSKEKAIVVLLPGDGLTPEAVARKATDLPPQRSVQLYHIGKRALDGVSYGLEGDTFKHPACDVGGLTNYRQRLGEDARFAGDPVPVGRAGDVMASAALVVGSWQALSPRPLPESLVRDVSVWLASALAAFGDVVLRFHQLPAEHRTVVTSSDVRRRTGRYYVRNFGGSSHACESDGIGLYCAVGEKFITPNITISNLEVEYRSYGDAPPSGCPGRPGAPSARLAGAAGQGGMAAMLRNCCCLP